MRFTVCIGIFLALRVIAAPDVVWIEGEAPTQKPGSAIDGMTLDSGNGAVHLSAGKLLVMTVSPETAQEQFPAEGVVFGYEFHMDAAGERDIWARIGFASSRSPFSWRIDDGDWTEVGKEKVLRDIVELSTWNPLGWMKLDRRRLDAGKHRIEFRHRVHMQGKKVGRTLFMLDAICIIGEDWLPNGRFKPGEEYRSERDLAAAKQVYAMPACAVGERSEVRLTGEWEIARWDEMSVDPAERLRMPGELPDLDRLHWYGIDVPGDRNAKRPELKYAHRYLYRTRVRVPEQMKDRGWILRLERFSMIAEIFVNGQSCGWNRNCQSTWACDVSKAVRPGEVNEIVIAFKDVIYGIDPSRKADRDLTRYWYVPLNRTFHVSLGMQMDMPVSWGHGGTAETGLCEPVILSSAGRAYTEDVFAIPSVNEKKLTLEITLFNPTASDARVQMENDVVLWRKDGSEEGPEKSFPVTNVNVRAGTRETVRLDVDWANPKLWFPDAPTLYNVVTRLRQEGRLLDTKRTRFGFREWGWEDRTAFTCNEVPWVFWCYAGGVDSVAELLEQCRRTGKNSIRYSTWATHIVDTDPRKISTSELLDELDEHGIVVRFNSLFDGEVANYGKGLTEKIDGEMTYNRALFGHLKDQFTQWIRGYRNHPSLLIWSLDNEVVYINSNLQGQSREWEPATRLLAEHAMTIDPTRPVMVDGGRALRDPAEWRGVDDSVKDLGHLPVNGCHYNEVKTYARRDYPDAAYSAEKWYTSPPPFGPWPMLRNKPIFMGECFYARGWPLGQMAGIGGETCFIGFEQTYPVRSTFMRWLSEGYRWNHTVAAWDFGLNNTTDEFLVAWKPIALFCRQWTTHMRSGAPNQRLLKAINQSSSQVELTLHCRLSAGDRSLVSLSKQVSLKPGGMEEWPVELNVPKVTDDRLDAEMVLSIEHDGKEIFRDARPMRIFASVSPTPLPQETELFVLDRHGAAIERLKARKIDFRLVDSPADVPAGRHVLLVGTDSVSVESAQDSVWQQLLADGVRLLVLEQANPLKYRAVPADLEPTAYEGRMAFCENLEHPAFASLHADDLSLWSDDHISYRNPYRKASRGATSLVQCDELLACTALAECRLGDGLMLLCQMPVGAKLRSDVVAGRLFDNLLYYAAAYEKPRKRAALLLDEGEPAARMLREMQLQGESVQDVRTALSADYEIAVVAADKANLSALQELEPELKAFTGRGGWLILWGLEPEGLELFNRLVGVDHLLRPYSPERPAFHMPRDPLAGGMTYRDLIMTTGERLVRWKGVERMSPTLFSWVVDTDDIAPFCVINGKAPSREAPVTPNPRNVVNNLTSDDLWMFMYYLHLDDGEPSSITLEMPRRETPQTLSIRFSTGYAAVTEMTVRYAGGDPAVFAVRPDNSVQQFRLPARATEKLVLDFTGWEQTGKRPILAVENLSLEVERSPAFREKVRPVTEPAGLVRYPMGQGGIVLNQIGVAERESNPVNAEKKASLIHRMLANLDAVFAGNKPVIVGSGLDYTPLPIAAERFNAFIKNDGKPPWFKPPRRAPRDADLSALPLGRSTFAKVPFEIFDFSTSPAPSCIMLRGEGSQVQDERVQGLPVQRKADALFFLHTYNPGQDVVKWQRAHEKSPSKAGEPPVLFHYLIHYADGKEARAPVVWGKDVAAWIQNEAPHNLIGAQLAWSAQAEGNAWHLALYALQWNNPRPDTKIESIAVVPAEQGASLGAPALLAITAATLPQRKQ